MRMHLATAFKPECLLVEMTSRCNLRCRYCQKSMDSWNATPGRDQDLDPGVERRIVDALAETPFETLQITGIGEFTFRDDWVASLKAMTDRGQPVALICNFAKPFDDAELDALLTLRHLMVSIDTTNPTLLRSVRKAVSFNTISLNLLRLRMRTRRAGIPGPYLKLNAVLYRENLGTIEDMAYFAAENRVQEMQYERMMKQTELSPPSDIETATPQEAAEALRQLEVAKRVLTHAGVTPSMHGDLIQLLERIA